MKLEQLKNIYLNDLAAQGYAAGTIRYRKTYLEQFLLFLSRITTSRKKTRDKRDRQLQGVAMIAELSKELIYRYQVRLARQDYTSLTVHSKLSVLSCFLNYLLKENHLLLDLASAISFPKRVLNLPQSILTETEVRRLLSLPDVRTKKGIRDKAMLELLYSTGIRRSELVNLDLYDLDRETQTIKVTGKGGKERVVPVGDVALYWLGRYFDMVRLPDSSPTCSEQSQKQQALFLDLIHRRRLSQHTVNNIIVDYREQSGLSKRITPHTFRHTCATHLLRHGADIRHIQEFLGHASPATTQLYARVEIRDLQSVFRSTHPRARRP